MSWANFSKVNQIMTYLKAHLFSIRLDRIDNLDVEISSRAPGSTSLSTEIWTAERAEKLDLALPIIVNLGSNYDPPDPNGSVHAKLRDLKVLVGTGNIDIGSSAGFSEDFSIYTPSIVSHRIDTLPSNQWVTIREITGSGYIPEVLCFPAPTQDTQESDVRIDIRITVDDDVVVHTTCRANYRNYTFDTTAYVWELQPAGFTLRKNINSHITAIPLTGRNIPIQQLFNIFYPSGFTIGGYPLGASNQVIASHTNYPFTSYTNPGVSLLYNPVRFNTNFKIEVYPINNVPLYLQNIVFLG